MTRMLKTILLTGTALAMLAAAPARSVEAVNGSNGVNPNGTVPMASIPTALTPMASIPTAFRPTVLPAASAQPIQPAGLAG